ncbi:MAG: hypothetical protein GWN87_15070, partial [Desulfuromonadales bacterium]|nr:hypothetical protein [Desulfuromonadales bacterium]
MRSGFGLSLADIRNLQPGRLVMLVGVPKEIKNHEYRVGLTPDSVQEFKAH